MEYTLIDNNTSKEISSAIFYKITIILSDLQSEYPFFERWLSKVRDELMNSNIRYIILCYEGNIFNIKGVAILKKTSLENKICTLRVIDGYKRKGIGTMLYKNAIKILNDPAPLITVSGLHMKEFAPFLRRNRAILKDKVKSIYRKGSYEYFYNVPYCHETVLMSIRPRYAEQIALGEKQIEFRKKIFSSTVKKVYIYSSSPTKRIIGYFNVTKIIKDTPDRLWKRFQNIGGISYKEYEKYYKGHNVGYGIVIKKFIPYSNPIDPIKQEPTFRAPQSYCYIDNIVTIKWLENQY